MATEEGYWELDVERLARALEGVTAMTGDDAIRWAPHIAREYDRSRKAADRAARLRIVPVAARKLDMTPEMEADLFSQADTMLNIPATPAERDDLVLALRLWVDSLADPSSSRALNRTQRAMATRLTNLADRLMMAEYPEIAATMPR